MNHDKDRDVSDSTSFRRLRRRKLRRPRETREFRESLSRFVFNPLKSKRIGSSREAMYVGPELVNHP